MSPLLEREGQLASLASAAAEGGRLVFVGGEAGVGKTALVRAFEAQIDGRVLRGSGRKARPAAPTPPRRSCTAGTTPVDPGRIRPS